MSLTIMQLRYQSTTFRLVCFLSLIVRHLPALPGFPLYLALHSIAVGPTIMQ